MRTLIARIFDYSVDGIIAEEGTSQGTRLFDELGRPARLELFSATVSGNGITELALRRP